MTQRVKRRERIARRRAARRGWLLSVKKTIQRYRDEGLIGDVRATAYEIADQRITNIDAIRTITPPGGHYPRPNRKTRRWYKRVEYGIGR